VRAPKVFFNSPVLRMPTASGKHRAFVNFEDLTLILPVD